MLRTPARRATAQAALVACRPAAADTPGARRSRPCSRASPASVQPMVPLCSATTRLGSPALISDWAPMMLLVRPAQFTTIVVAGSGASVRARSTSSAPGTLVAVGMLIVWYSSKRRASRTATPEPSRSRALSSPAVTPGVPAVAATSSPKALLGALTSRNSTPPVAAHPARPPASSETSR